jgi:hypothetical protein
MSLFVRELLFDLAANRLDIITRSDLQCSIQHLLDTRQVDTHDILLVDRYIAGYSVMELEQEQRSVSERLHRTLSLIAQRSGYTDDLLLRQLLIKYPKYKSTAEAFRNKLDRVSREF